MTKDEIVRLLKLSLEMHEESGLNLGFSLEGAKLVADLRAAIERIEAAPAVDCSICTNRGGVYALSQESNCDHCIWQGRRYKKDLFATSQKENNGTTFKK